MLTFYVKLGYTSWLQTHKYLGLAYAFISLHVILTPNRITGDPVMRGYLYSLLAVGTASFIYRTLLPNIFVRRFAYTIMSAVPKGVGLIEVTLAPISRSVRIRAGQFIYVSFNSSGLSNEWHPFSVSSSEQSGHLTIDIKSLGKYTEKLTQVLPYLVGMTAQVEGAYGRFSYRNFENRNQVWIAGGIGITPFISMAQSLKPDQPYNIDLYYAVKSESELIDVDTLSAQQTNTPTHVFRVFPFAAEALNTHLSAAIIAQNSGDLKKRDFLMCGPPGMIKSIRKQLIDRGASPKQIHSEEFSLQ